VSSLAGAFAVEDPAASPAARFTPLGRIAAAGTLVVGATLQVLAFAFIPDYGHTVDKLHWIAAHPAQAQVSKTFDLLAVPFLLAGVIVYVLLARERAPRLAWTGGILLWFGMCGLMAVQGYETLEFSLVHDGRFRLTAVADVVDNLSTAPEVAMGIMFIVCAVLGIVVTAVALWRSRAVPRAIPVLLVTFIVVDAALSQPLLGHVIALVGAVWIAYSILRAGRPAAGSAAV
jgi:hypothetical protein